MSCIIFSENKMFSATILYGALRLNIAWNISIVLLDDAD